MSLGKKLVNLRYERNIIFIFSPLQPIYSYHTAKTRGNIEYFSKNNCNRKYSCYFHLSIHGWISSSSDSFKFNNILNESLKKHQRRPDNQGEGLVEVIGIIFIILSILGKFVEGFSAFNLIQFFRGKETPLEKIAKRYQSEKNNAMGGFN